MEVLKVMCPLIIMAVTILIYLGKEAVDYDRRT